MHNLAMLATYAARQPTRLSAANCDALATGCQTLEDSQHLSTDPLGPLEDSCASEDAVLSHAMHTVVCIKAETQVQNVQSMASTWQLNCSTLKSLHTNLSHVTVVVCRAETSATIIV